MTLKTLLIGVLLLIISNYSFEQIVVKTIQSFGAKGDGKTNDTQAFEKAAAYFNSIGGNGKLIITKGTYIVGTQNFNNGAKGKLCYSGEDILHFLHIKNMVVVGQGAILKFADSLRLGAFDPATGKIYNHGNTRFTNYAYAAQIGNCIYIDSCDNVKITGVKLDGNNPAIIIGGGFGDIAIQLTHDGISVHDSHNIIIDSVSASYFGRDGLYIRNDPSDQPDNIQVLNSVFEYNFRQGFSWVGGNGVIVKNCGFNHTGKSRYASPPAAGVDVEGEVGLSYNGLFENSSFIDNTGCGIVSDGGGKDSNCHFINCTFWGTTSYAVWVTKPAFTFSNCTIYGSIAHGYSSPNDQDATRFIKCHIEDKSYNGNKPRDGYLINSNAAYRMSFDNCTLVANTVKLMWMDTKGVVPAEEKYNVSNCHFIVMGSAYPQKDFVAVMRGVNYKNNTLEFKDPAAKDKGYWLNGCCNTNTIDLGGNTIIYDK
jgi:parallel beta helix pectate lyase-like protein